MLDTYFKGQKEGHRTRGGLARLTVRGEFGSPSPIGLECEMDKIVLSSNAKMGDEDEENGEELKDEDIGNGEGDFEQTKDDYDTSLKGLIRAMNQELNLKGGINQQKNIQQFDLQDTAHIRNIMPDESNRG
ncbi:hypothetical protein BGX34_002533 [Mortierella sp. NVP85]|nr:hypothetical protein BGX34_002533 [Mortierella sp. NVP85]